MSLTINAGRLWIESFDLGSGLSTVCGHALCGQPADDADQFALVDDPELALHHIRSTAFALMTLLCAPVALAQAADESVAQSQPKPAQPGPMMITKTGLEYQVLVEGSGPKPIRADNVTVHYRGTLTNGSVFDSSYRNGAPVSFALTGVIKGWAEGLQLMSVGSKYKFIIPPYLGYGASGSGDAVPPNATLIFEVELLSIN